MRSVAAAALAQGWSAGDLARHLSTPKKPVFVQNLMRQLMTEHPRAATVAAYQQAMGLGLLQVAKTFALSLLALTGNDKSAAAQVVDCAERVLARLTIGTAPLADVRRHIAVTGP